MGIIRISWGNVYSQGRGMVVFRVRKTELGTPHVKKSVLFRAGSVALQDGEVYVLDCLI